MYNASRSMYVAVIFRVMFNTTSPVIATFSCVSSLETKEIPRVPSRSAKTLSQSSRTAHTSSKQLSSNGSVKSSSMNIKNCRRLSRVDRTICIILCRRHVLIRWPVKWRKYFDFRSPVFQLYVSAVGELRETTKRHLI